MTYQYDKKSHIIEENHVNLLTHMSVKRFDKTTTYEYNRVNHLVRSDMDKSYNGQTLDTRESIYTYDDSVLLYAGNDWNVNDAGMMDSASIFYVNEPGGNVIFEEEKDTKGNLVSYGYTKDLRGSTSNIVDNDGDPVVNYEYDDFGETQIKESEVVQNELMYTGAVYDRGPRQYYLNARYYQPEKGNFLTQGTYRGEQTEPKTWNLYGYCAGNPINYTDPTGHGAMWLQQRDGARYAGHTAVSIHIGDSTWHYFSAEPVSQSFPEIVTGVKMNIVYRKTSIPPSRWKKNQKMSRVLSSKHGGVKYTEAHYFTGNFRNSYNLMSTLRTQKNLTYKLGSSNCKHMAILALKQGKNLKHPAVFNTLMHLASVQAVPNFAFQIIKRYKDS